MPRITSHSLKEKDEPILQQNEIHLQYLSQDKKATIASGTALRAIALGSYLRSSKT